MSADPETQESIFQRGLDPDVDDRYLRGFRELVEVPIPARTATTARLPKQAEVSSPADPELAPGAFDEWHFGGYFDDRLPHDRLGWSAY